MLNLKICLINAENLFLVFNKDLPTHFKSMDKNQWQSLATEVYYNKPLNKTLHLAETLKDIDADIIMMTEVGGSESLKNFNTYFLDDKYSPIIIEGNSDRHIDVAFLIKKGQNFYYDLFSHKNHELDLKYPQRPNEVLRFSRDCAELRLFTQNVDSPFLIMLLTHLKSPLDPENIDSSGTLRRKAELIACVDIYSDLQSKFSNTPIIFAGDFNGNASLTNPDAEFTYLYEKTKLRDVFEVAEAPNEQRVSFIQVKNGLSAEIKQIDYVFLSQHLFDKLNKTSVQSYLYKDEFGFDLGIPKSLEEKTKLPSDHYPLIFVLENLNK